MKTSTRASRFGSQGASRREHGPTYAPASQARALLRAGARFRRERIDAADMVTTDEAAGLAGTTSVTVIAWIKSARAIGVSHVGRGFKLPRWQFEPAIWPAVQPIAHALGTSDGWQLLSFLERPSPLLNGLAPRAALEQGSDLARILAVAATEAH